MKTEQYIIDSAIRVFLDEFCKEESELHDSQLDVILDDHTEVEWDDTIFYMPESSVFWGEKEQIIHGFLVAYMEAGRKFKELQMFFL